MQTVHNGDVSSWSIPTLLSDLSGTLPAASVAAGTFPSGMTLVAPVLGTPASGTLTNCTFPTLNQNTTGSSASLSISGQTGLLTVTGLTSTNRIKTVRDAADTLLELGGSYTPTGTWTSLTLVTPALGTPASGILTNCTFPTLNQNTTGTSGGLTGTPAITVGAIISASETCSGVVQAKRVTAHGGTALTSAAFAASSGWGTSPTITLVQGTDQAGSVTITAKATVGASPTLTLTFHDGTWTQVPIVVCSRTDTASATGAPTVAVTNMWHVTSVTATTVVFTFLGTPVANSTYGLTWIAMGT